MMSLAARCPKCYCQKFQLTLLYRYKLFADDISYAIEDLLTEHRRTIPQQTEL